MEASVLMALAAPLLMGLAAIGILLSIKIARRRQATRDATAGHPSPVGDAVPARPLSQRDAAVMVRRYLWSAAVIAAALGLALVLMAPA
jgi:hypothetical protein